MDIKQAETLVNVLYVAFPATYRGWEKSQFSLVARLMAKTFEHIPAELVTKAVEKNIAENRTNFAPSMGEIMHNVKSMLSDYDAVSQWEGICWITRNVDRENVSKELRDMDAITQKIVRGSDIRRWKDTAGSLDRERPVFLEKYNKLKEEKEAEAVNTGNLLAVATEERLRSLGVDVSALPQIEQKKPDAGINR